MANLELGNIMFNTNVNQRYDCPDYIIALLRDIERVYLRVMWNIKQEEIDSPFQNTSNSFENDVFKVQAYSWDDEVEQEYNFYYKFKKGMQYEVKISWYKHLGRDTTINDNYDYSLMVSMYEDCIQSLNKLESETLNKRDMEVMGDE